MVLEATVLPTEPPPLPNNLYYLALDVTATCISEIYSFAPDGFDLNIVRKLSSKKKNISRVGIQTRGCWVGSKKSSSVLRSPRDGWVVPPWPGFVAQMLVK